MNGSEFSEISTIKKGLQVKCHTLVGSSQKRVDIVVAGTQQYVCLCVFDRSLRVRYMSLDRI